MPVHASETSLRPGRLELSRLGWALGISIAIHLAGFGGYEIAKVVLPAWAERFAILAELMRRAQPPKTPPPPEAEPPLVFVEVNPQSASADAPKDTKFYSDRNSLAANPEPDRDTAVPKISGTQTEIPKTEDTLRPSADRLQPDLTPPERAKPAQPPGDLAMVKPDVNLHPDTGTAEQTRPRTITEAKMRQPQQQKIIAPKMKQDGGVNRPRLEASFDAKGTAFGAYDAEFIEAVQQHWYDLLDRYNYAFDRSGRVVLKFRLNPDGRITDMEVVDQNVGETLTFLCKRAVQDPSKYREWPREMRLMVNKEYREIQFVFYYN